METERERIEAANGAGNGPNLWLGLGLAVGLVGLAWLSRGAVRQPARRRYADRGMERRNPLHFFLAGNYPRRRAIDRSGARPLFERRQSVYDAY